MNLAVVNPNFSIIVPAGCNAKCDFCFWKKPEKSLERKEYLKNLQNVLASLPSSFAQCSITGGEPTSCTFLRDILTLVRLKFEKVVLSSNGYKVEPWLFEYIDHLNISRHRTDDLKNEEVFGTTTVPNWLQLKEICYQANLAGVDVTLNTVVPADLKKEKFIFKMIEFAKLVDANSVCFRKIHGDCEDMPFEKDFAYKVTYEHGCGVCRVKERLVLGMKTTFRYSVLEPSQDLGAIYELVLQPDGMVTSDWEAKNPVDVFETDTKPDPRKEPAPTKTKMKTAKEMGCHGTYSVKVEEPYYATGQPQPSGCGRAAIERSCGIGTNVIWSSCGTSGCG